MSIYKKGYQERFVEDPNAIADLIRLYSPHVSASSHTAPALKLDNRTQLNTVQKIVVVRDYGSGVVEVGFSSPPSPNQPDVDHRKPKDSVLKNDAANLDRSVRRSKANVRRKVMSADLDFMVTLTYRENMQCLDRGWTDFKRFIRLIRVTQPDYKYVAVAELQQRGAVHFHVAVKGWQQLELLRSIWRGIVGEGNVQISRPKYQVTLKWQLAKLAGYLSKYITKDLTSAFGRQRYRVSEGIVVPCVRRLLVFPFGVDWIGEIFDSLGAQVGFRHESDQGWSWACSW